MWKGAYPRFRGKLAFAKCFRERSCFQLLETRVATSSWPHLSLHWHIFLFIGTSSFPFMGTSSPSMGTSSPSWPHIPLHWHIFLFIGTSSFPFMGTSSPSMGTSSPSWPHIPLHWHIFLFIGTSSFPFIGTSSPSLAPLRLHRHIFPFMGTSSFQGCGGGALAGHGLLPRELSRGFRRDTRGALSQKCPIRFMPHLHALNLRGETSKTDPRFAYADCLREDYHEASARCLRVPTRTCKYQCFRFRGVNMSSPHKKVPSFQKKTWLNWISPGSLRARP